MTRPGPSPMTSPAPRPSPVAVLREHPLLVAALVGCVAIGAGLAVTFGTDEWSVGRRVAAGALAGFGSWFVVVANRLLGAWKDPEDPEDPAA